MSPIHNHHNSLTHTDKFFSYVQKPLSEEMLAYHLINKLLFISTEDQFIADAPEVCCEVLEKASLLNGSNGKQNLLLIYGMTKLV